MTGIGRWHGLVIDCPDPGALATFYEALLGMLRVQDSPDFVVIGDAPDRPGVAFQRVADFVAPDWPLESSQMHFDVRVPDLDEATGAVSALGAKRLEGGGERFRVFADRWVTRSAWSPGRRLLLRPASRRPTCGACAPA